MYRTRKNWLKIVQDEGKIKYYYFKTTKEVDYEGRTLDKN